MLLARSSLRRSLSMAEEIGDIPLMCVVLGNTGVLAMRLGELIEAEEYGSRQGIELAESINDPIYASILSTYLVYCITRKRRLYKRQKKCASCIIFCTML